MNQASYGDQMQYNAYCNRCNEIVDALNGDHSEELDYFDKPLDMKEGERDALRAEYLGILKSMRHMPEGDYSYDIVTHLLTKKW